MLSSAQRAAHTRAQSHVRPRWLVAAIVLIAILLGVAASAGGASAPRSGGKVSLTGGVAGRWVVGHDGVVTPLGSSAPLNPGRSGTVGAASDPAGGALVTTTAAGIVTTHGTMPWSGDLREIRLNQEIVDLAVTPSREGYWLVARDGGVFAFGDAAFHGSTGHLILNEPIVGIAPTPTGAGYWLVASDGGIFAFGDAAFHGSTGHLILNEPIVGIAPTPTGAGYWLVASDGGIFAFGNATYHGSLADHWTTDVVDIIATPTGYALADSWGRVTEFGTRSADTTNDEWTVPRTTNHSAIAAELFDRMNSERLARGLRPLLWDVRLATTATEWSAAMSTTGFRHSDVAATATRLGGYEALAENIYRGTLSFADAGSAHSGFMTSSEHRHTLLAPIYTTAAVGVVCDAAGQLWVTVHFGTPKGHAPGLSRVPTAPDPVASPDQNGAHCRS